MQCLNKNCDGHYEPICRKCEMPRWISVKEMMPEIYFFVLVYSKIPGNSEPCPITIARWEGERWETLCNEDENNACASGDLFWATESDEITHWMPLPKPPC